MGNGFAPEDQEDPTDTDITDFLPLAPPNPPTVTPRFQTENGESLSLNSCDVNDSSFPAILILQLPPPFLREFQIRVINTPDYA